MSRKAIEESECFYKEKERYIEHYGLHISMAITYVFLIGAELMTESQDNLPLKLYIPVAKVFYPFPIHFLRIASLTPYDKSLSRILNSLKENQVTTVDMALNTTVNQLRSSRNFGDKGVFVLISLLNNISKQPELVIHTDKLDSDLRLEVERLKQMPSIKKQFNEMGIDWVQDV